MRGRLRIATWLKRTSLATFAIAAVLVSLLTFVTPANKAAAACANAQAPATCFSPTDCTAAGFKWTVPTGTGSTGHCIYPDSNTTCDSDHLSNCKIAKDCTDKGGTPLPTGTPGQITCVPKDSLTCSSSNLSACKDADECRANGGVPTGAAGSIDTRACLTQDQANAQCDKDHLTKCTSVDACKNAGGSYTPTGVPGQFSCIALTQEPTNGTGDDDNGESKFIDCGSGGFNFFICPALKLAIAAGSKIDSFIMQQLNVDATAIFDKTNDPNSPSSGYYQAWSQFRIIATSLLIIGGLVMIVSTALGFEFLDAYTIRKTLPRLLIAIIGISLSWPLMKLCVTFFDTLGFDIRAIMYHPFEQMKGQVGVGTGILSTFTVGVGLFAFGPTALTFILTACLALFVGFLILIIRQAAIIMLVILAPVAIACFILPNTQKVWKLWYDNFLGLLLMFPIISALIAAGHIFAAVTVSSNQGDSPQAVIAQAIAIIAYFIPYFLLPMAARLATGIIGNLAGFVNDKHKGAFDRLKGARDNARKNRHQMRMNEQMSKGKFGNAYRRLSSVGTPNSGALGVTRGGRAKYAAFRQNVRQQMAAEALKNDNGRAAGDDDATALAVQRGMTAQRFMQQYQQMGHSRQEAEMALATTERGFNAKMGSDAMALASFKARASSSTAYSGDAAGTQQRFNEGAALINAGLMNAADATAAGKGNRARVDINGAGFSTQMKAFSEAAALQQQGRVGMSLQRAEQHLDNVVQEAEPGDLLGGNTRTITALAPAMMRNLDNAMRNARGADGKVDLNNTGLNRALGQIAGIQDNLNRTSAQKAGMFADFVNSAQVQLGTTDTGDAAFISVRQAVSNAANAVGGSHGNQEFLAVRKEYGSAATRGPLQNQPAPEPEG